MKIWKNKFLKRLIIIITVIFLIINCITPSSVYADKSQEADGVNWKTIVMGIAGVAGVAAGFFTFGLSWSVLAVGAVTCVAAGTAYDVAVEGEDLGDIPRSPVKRIVYINGSIRRCCNGNVTIFYAWC